MVDQGPPAPTGAWRRGIYVGLGANLGADPAQAILDALAALDREPGLRVLRRSRRYRTPPWGPLPQPDYVNAVAELAASLPTSAIVERLLAVERGLGRERAGPRYGPRTIDLDLLLDGDRVLTVPGVSVPHPRIAERAFVLVPLAELDPEVVVPGIGSARNLMAALGDGAREIHPIAGD